MSKRAQLYHARRAYAQRAWADAYNAFLLAEQEAPLEADDLELLAMTAYLTGRDEEYLRALERAYHAQLGVGQSVRAVRCAFWLSLRLIFRGEMGRASGWIGRAQRLVETIDRECAERGLLLLPAMEQRLASGALEAAYGVASEIAAIGERCRDADLIACARHKQGIIRLRQGQIEAGLALLDEAMLSVIAGELSPITTGLIYCSVIEACQQVYALDRAQEWTAALAQWCEEQSELVAFVGVCRVHRAEIMQLRGAWQDALEEAQRAYARSHGVNQEAAAAALYQRGEVHRLKGEFAAAEEAYRGASDLGLEPQPGLALLRVAQGRPDVAAAAIRRVAGATVDQLKRMRLLPAYIEIMLTVGDTSDARNACRELQEMTQMFNTAVARAIAAQACGAVQLAEGSPQAALGPLRSAFEVWQRIEAPYAAARVRVLIGLACRVLGDEDGAALELAAATATFQRLGAASSFAQIGTLINAAPSCYLHGLTPRELQVLRLVAAGDTNKVIASKLSLSEKTVDRHVSNIFAKLNVSSRAAATAFAYRHKLI